MRPEKKRAAEVLDAPNAAHEGTTSDPNCAGNSTEAQRHRILIHLQSIGPITTIEMRRDLDILMPGARIHELRHKFGKNITTVWAHQPTECGKLHRVARYFLAGGEK